MKSINYSVTGTKFSANCGAALVVAREVGYRPDIATGISGGSLKLVPMAMGFEDASIWDHLEDLAKNYELSQVFSIVPEGKLGGLSFKAIVRLLKGEPSIGKMDKLADLYKSIVTKSLFEDYKKSSQATKNYVGIVELRSGRKEFIPLKQLDYETHVKAVIASCSIPFLAEPVDVLNNGELWVDGGTRNHVGSNWLFDKYGKAIKKNISIYSRPENYKVEEPNLKNKAIPVLLRSIEIMMVEISKKNQRLEEELTEEYGIKNTQIFMPYLLSESILEYSKELSTEWFEIGRQAARKQFFK